MDCDLVQYLAAVATIIAAIFGTPMAFVTWSQRRRLVLHLKVVDLNHGEGFKVEVSVHNPSIHPMMCGPVGWTDDKGKDHELLPIRQVIEPGQPTVRYAHWKPVGSSGLVRRISDMNVHVRDIWVTDGRGLGWRSRHRVPTSDAVKFAFDLNEAILKHRNDPPPEPPRPEPRLNTF